MILDAFSLQGKVAVVTGCDTGLGQGMALGLAEAGCDIVGINIVEPTETIERVTALGRRLHGSWPGYGVRSGRSRLRYRGYQYC
ncbi:2-dehydro-3-deoxy-D-gluconate 5-dehydrogenase [compost metagenome]